MDHYECGNLFGASRRLLEGSGLVRYDYGSFESNSDEEKLEKCWREGFDEEFGRYMAWVWFSVGAENLAKAALVCNRLLKGKAGEPQLPDLLARHGQRGLGRQDAKVPARPRGWVWSPGRHLEMQAR